MPGTLVPCDAVINLKIYLGQYIDLHKISQGMCDLYSDS